MFINPLQLVHGAPPPKTQQAYHYIFGHFMEKLLLIPLYNFRHIFGIPWASCDQQRKGAYLV